MLTKEQQKELVEVLSQMIARAEFRLDGHEIQVERRRVSDSTTALLVFVDGKLSEYVGHAPDDSNVPNIFRKVWRVRSKARYSTKHIKDIKKTCGKRRAKKWYPDLHERYYFLDPRFNTATSLVRQFAKLEGLEPLNVKGINL